MQLLHLPLAGVEDLQEPQHVAAIEHAHVFPLVVLGEWHPKAEWCLCLRMRQASEATACERG